MLRMSVRTSMIARQGTLRDKGRDKRLLDERVAMLGGNLMEGNLLFNEIV